MRYGVLGTGMVGQALARRLVGLGHQVRMGAREARNPKAVAFVEEAGELASEGRFADAAAFGEVVINATEGTASLDALAAAGADNLAGKILIDVSNGLVRGDGLPTLAAVNDDSLGERIQAAFPDARVVKTLNTVNANVMVDPAGRLPETGNVFLSGDDEAAKQGVAALLEGFGWPQEVIVDLGDITSARGPEMYLALWLRLWQVRGDLNFNIRVVGSG